MKKRGCNDSVLPSHPESPQGNLLHHDSPLGFIRKSGEDTTVHVPGESVSKLLTLNLHVQADWHQNFRLSSVLVDHSWIMVVKAAQAKHRGLELSIRC